MPKVGEKTATKWIAQYGDLDSLIEHADEIKGVAGDNFRERIDQVRLNRELTQMVTDVELPVGPEDLEVKPADVNAVASSFDNLEFGVNVRERVLAAVPTTGEAPAPEVEELQEIDIEDTPLDQWLTERKGQGLAVVVTGNGAPGRGDASALAIVDKQRRGIHKEIPELSPQEDSALKVWVESEDPKYLHDAKTVFHMLKGRDITLRGIAHDTAIAAYLLRPGQRTCLLYTFPSPRD